MDSYLKQEHRLGFYNRKGEIISKFTNVSLCWTIENCSLNDWIQQFILLFIFSKGSIFLHKIININNFPDPKQYFSNHSIKVSDLYLLSICFGAIIWISTTKCSQVCIPHHRLEFIWPGILKEYVFSIIL